MEDLGLRWVEERGVYCGWIERVCWQWGWLRGFRGCGEEVVPAVLFGLEAAWLLVLVWGQKGQEEDLPC